MAPLLFDYVYQHIHPKVLLGSITGIYFKLMWFCLSNRLEGGTDICSLFAGMCSALPVYRGEIQCRMLGMAIESFTPMGTPSAPDEAGELVCVKPFPCMPLGFWPLPGFGRASDQEAAKERYKQSYFAEFEGVWCKSASFVECNITLKFTRSWGPRYYHTFEEWKWGRPTHARTLRWCAVSLLAMFPSM